MTYLLDTDWAIWALRGRSEVAERVKALRGEGLAISAVTLAELVTGPPLRRSKEGGRWTPTLSGAGSACCLHSGGRAPIRKRECKATRDRPSN